jgi:hypothetical protein
VRLTWNVVTIAWDRRGDTIVGRTATTGVLAHHRPIDRATATISFRYRVLGGRKGWVGLRPPDPEQGRLPRGDAHVARERPLERARESPLDPARRGRLRGAAYRDTWHAVTIRFTEKEIRVTVDGKELPPLRRKAAEPLGRVGLFIDACEAEFVGFVVR